MCELENMVSSMTTPKKPADTCGFFSKFGKIIYPRKKPLFRKFSISVKYNYFEVDYITNDVSNDIWGEGNKTVVRREFVEQKI